MSKTNIFFSHLEGTRGEKTQIFRTLDSWSRFHDLPKKLTHASGAVVVGETGRDIGYLVSGGQGTKINFFLKDMLLVKPTNPVR